MSSEKNVENLASAEDARNFINKPALIRQRIEQGKPEDHHAIRKYGLIDSVRFPWRRNELYRALETAEKTAPSEFVFKRYFDAPAQGYYARKRKEKYQAEADQLPVEFKVEFILKYPEKAEYFFGNARFVKELTERRPDLLFKLIDKKENYWKTFQKSLLRSASDASCCALVNAAMENGTLDQNKALQYVLQSMGLAWFEDSFSMKILDAQITTLESAKKREKDRAKAEKEAKGKEDVADAPVLKIPAAKKNITAKIEAANMQQLEAAVEEYKHFSRLEIFLPDGILVIDDSSRRRKLHYYTDQLEPVCFSDDFPEWSWKTTYLTSEEFLQATQRRISPDMLPEESPLQGFFARLSRWWRNFGKPPLPQRKPVATTQYPNRRQDSHAMIADQLFSASEADTSLDDTQSEDVASRVQTSSPLQIGLDQYQSAKAAFLLGNYEEAMGIIGKMFLGFERQYSSSDVREVKTYDSMSLKTTLLMKILRSQKVSFTDSLMVDELLKQKKSHSELSNLTDLQAALEKILGEFDYNSHVDLRGLTPEWRVAFQLFVLERKFNDLQNKKSHFDYQRKVGKLQRDYLELVQLHAKVPLVQAMAKRSHLLNYNASGKVSETRITVMNMFERDPNALIQQMFNVLEENTLSQERASKFISSVIAKVGLDRIFEHVRDHYHQGLSILIENSTYFRRELLERELLMLSIAECGIPEVRQALRSAKLKLPETVLLALTQAVESDLRNIVEDLSKAHEKFSDGFFVEEIEANLAMKQIILNNEVLAETYKKYGPSYLDGIQQMFTKLAKDETVLAKEYISSILEQAGLAQVIGCINTLSPDGLKLFLDKYSPGRALLQSNEKALQELANSRFAQVRQELRESGLTLSEEVKGILAEKVQNVVNSLSNVEEAKEKLSDRFFVAELLDQENSVARGEFESKYEGLLVAAAHDSSVGSSQAPGVK